MKITFVGTFTVEDLELINFVIKTQESTDRATEPHVASYDNTIQAKFIVKKNDNSLKFDYDNTYIDKVIFRKI